MRFLDSSQELQLYFNSTRLWAGQKPVEMAFPGHSHRLGLEQFFDAAENQDGSSAVSPRAVSGPGLISPCQAKLFFRGGVASPEEDGSQKPMGSLHV